MILAVHTYPGGNEAFARHYPTWLNKGFNNIIAIVTKGGSCSTPEGVSHVEIGNNEYINGKVLPVRLLDTIEWLLTHYPDQDFGIIEYDTIFLKPFSKPAQDGLHAVICGGKPWGLKCNRFFHNPWIANAKTWRKILEGGRKLIEEGEFVGGSPDTFIGWLIERFDIPYVESFGLFTRNSIECEADIIEARKALKSGVNAIHGVKTKNVLHRILSP